MISIESGILLKNHAVVIYAKILHHSFTFFFHIFVEIPGTHWVMAGLINATLITETSYRKCSMTKLFLKISQNSQEHTCLIKFYDPACNFITLAKLFSCKFYDIFKNNFFYRTTPGDCFSKKFTLRLVRTNVISFYDKFPILVLHWFDPCMEPVDTLL